MDLVGYVINHSVLYKLISNHTRMAFTDNILMEKFQGIHECISNHISNVMQKLNVKGRSQAVVELIKLGELKI
jgi:hypothetical protein